MPGHRQPHAVLGRIGRGGVVRRRAKRHGQRVAGHNKRPHRPHARVVAAFAVGHARRSVERRPQLVPQGKVRVQLQRVFLLQGAAPGVELHDEPRRGLRELHLPLVPGRRHVRVLRLQHHVAVVAGPLPPVHNDAAAVLLLFLFQFFCLQRLKHRLPVTGRQLRRHHRRVDRVQRPHDGGQLRQRRLGHVAVGGCHLGQIRQQRRQQRRKQRVAAQHVQQQGVHCAGADRRARRVGRCVRFQHHVQHVARFRQQRRRVCNERRLGGFHGGIGHIGGRVGVRLVVRDGAAGHRLVVQNLRNLARRVPRAVPAARRVRKLPLQAVVGRDERRAVAVKRGAARRDGGFNGVHRVRRNVNRLVKHHLPGRAAVGLKRVDSRRQQSCSVAFVQLEVHSLLARRPGRVPVHADASDGDGVVDSERHGVDAAVAPAVAGGRVPHARLHWAVATAGRHCIGRFTSPRRFAQCAHRRRVQLGEQRHRRFGVRRQRRRRPAAG